MSDEQFLKEIRKIKLKPPTADRTGTVYEKPRIRVFTYHKLIKLNDVSDDKNIFPNDDTKRNEIKRLTKLYKECKSKYAKTKKYKI